MTPLLTDQPPSLETLPAYGLLLLAGMGAGALNAVAGGGTLISFPVLMAVGVPPVMANASNSVALWPGAVASAIGFLPQLQPVQHHLKRLWWPTLVGALLGAWLLVSTSERAFQVAIPVLLGLATVLLAFQPSIKQWSTHHRGKLVGSGSVLAQGLVSVYGGYFGAGMGILMLAVLGTMAEGTLHQLNALKSWLGLLINLSASLFFLGMGLLWWWPSLAVMVGAVLGGFLGARLSQRVNPEQLRKAIVGLGLLMALYYALRAL